MTETHLGLLLIHPAITATPELVEKAKDEAAAKHIRVGDQFLINKLNDGSIKLKDGKYDVISYLTPEASESIKFPVKLIPVLADALKVGGLLYGLSDAYKVDALISGFQISNDAEYHWTKVQISSETVAIPLKSNISRNKTTTSKLPSFKKSNITATKPLPRFNKVIAEPVKIAKLDDDLDEDEDDEDVVNDSKAKYFIDLNDDDFIEEDDLVKEDEDVSTGITMITCGKSKTKRKRACKDCSCGLKELEDQEIDNVRKQQDTVVKFTEEELTEIDFTIEGKKVGGCGSCSLGDAFRCSGCPYLGLPAFKPGQSINLNSILDDL